MVQGWFRAAAKGAAVVSAGLVLAAFGLAGPGLASNPPCPAAAPALIGAPQLTAIKGHLDRREPVHILAIGSSSTQGVGASTPALSYPAQLERYLEASWDSDAVTVENAGIGGETANETVRRLEAELKELPDLVIWQIGTNDAVRGRDLGEFRALVEQGIAAAKAAGVEIILLDQQYYPGIADPVRYEGFVEAVRDLGQLSKTPVFSRYALMKTWSAHSAEELRAMLSQDGFHMSDRGYTCLTSALGGSFAPMVQPRPSPAATAQAVLSRTGR